MNNYDSRQEKVQIGETKVQGDNCQFTSKDRKTREHGIFSVHHFFRKTGKVFASNECDEVKSKSGFKCSHV